MRDDTVVLDTSVSTCPRLIVEVPPAQQAAVREALERLSRSENVVPVQTIILDAVRAAVEQDYFWTPEWQAKEQAAERAIAEGHVRTFDTMEEMIDFLDRQ